MFQESCNDKMDHNNSKKFEGTKHTQENKEKIHTVPVVRQDSATHDIGLGNSLNETQPKNMNQARSCMKQENFCEGNICEAKNGTSQQHSQAKQDRLIESPFLGVHQKQRRQEVPYGISDSSPPSCVTNAPKSTCPATEELFNKQPVSSKEYSKVFHYDEPAYIETEIEKAEATNTFKDKNDIGKVKGRNLELLAIFRKDSLTNVLLVVVVLLAVGYAHLHMRLEAIEKGGFLPSKVRCKCHQKEGQATDTRGLQSGNEEVYKNINKYFKYKNKTTPAAIDSSPLSGVSENQNYPESDFLLRNYPNEIDPKHKDSVVDDLIGKQEGNKYNTIQGSGNSTHSINDSTKIEFGELANLNNKPVVRKDENLIHVNNKGSYSGLESGVRVIDLLDLSLYPAGERHSRHVRSSKKKGGHIVKDPSFSNAMKAGLNESENNNKLEKPDESKITQERPEKVGEKSEKPPKSKKQNDNKRKHSIKVETFEAQFLSEAAFDYDEHFMITGTSDGNCFVHNDWGHGTTVCRDANVTIPGKHSILPFYYPTNETARKKPGQRLIMTEAELKKKVKTSGKFVVRVPGDYFVQLNMLIEDITASHFLALYLNDEAMFACQPGGFRCPKMNHKDSSKFRVCNIMGLIELKKNDTINIRTMEPNMSLHIGQERASYFKFILLNEEK